MDKPGVKKTVEFGRGLVRPLKALADTTGLGIDALVNIAVYELLVRTGHVRPDSVSVPPPADLKLVEQVEPAPSPRVRPSPASARAAQPAGHLYFSVDDGPPVAVRKKVFLLGRGSKCDYILRDRGVSREHAVITMERGGWFIEDLNSANGVWLDGEQISKLRLKGGEEIQICNYTLRFVIK